MEKLMEFRDWLREQETVANDNLSTFMRGSRAYTEYCAEWRTYCEVLQKLEQIVGVIPWTVRQRTHSGKAPIIGVGADEK